MPGDTGVRDRALRRAGDDDGGVRDRALVRDRYEAAGRAGERVRAAAAVRDRERGAAVVDFALVAGLLALVFAGVVQLTLAVHVRNTLVDCAAEGARYAALADRTTDDGVARTRALIGASLADGYGDQVTAVEMDLRGLPVVEVRVTAPLPVVGLLGPGGTLTVTGHALREQP